MTEDELYAKWPVLRDIKIPEDSKCCFGCASTYVADIAGWPAAYDWEYVMFAKDWDEL